MSTYSEKLKDRRWLCRRADMIARADGCCKECGEDEAGAGCAIQVHHLTYLRGVEPWDYPDELLRVVCKNCHTDRQVEDEEALIEFARLLNGLSYPQVRALTKRIRSHNDGGFLEQPIFDAYNAILGRPSVARQWRALA